MQNTLLACLLFNACQVIKLLLDHGAVASSRCSHALRWAVKNGAPPVCELLVARGAYPTDVPEDVLIEAAAKGGQHKLAADCVRGHREAWLQDLQGLGDGMAAGGSKQSQK